MFNIGPMELVVIAIVGIVVIGPEKLPGFVRQAAQMMRTLRELATGAQKQLRDELGPEFSDVDLRNLNPRTAMRKAVFGDDFEGFDPRKSMRQAVFGDEDPADSDPRKAFRDARDSYYDDSDDETGVNGRHVNGTSGSTVSFSKSDASEGTAEPSARPRPRPRPAYGDDDVL